MVQHTPVALIFILWCKVSVTFGFGSDGHTIVANLAWDMLEVETKTWVEDLLDNSPVFYGVHLLGLSCPGCSPLGIVANWADVVREGFLYSSTASQHFINVQEDQLTGGCPVLDPEANFSETECQLDYERDCEDGSCIVGAVLDYANTLASPSRRSLLFFADVQREALMFLVHLFADIHQPMHCSRLSDLGGNRISVSFLGDAGGIGSSLLCSIPVISLFFDCRSELDLHDVWDDNIVGTRINEDFNGSREDCEAYLATKVEEAKSGDLYSEWMACSDATNQACAMEWANNSLEIGLKYAYRNTDGSEVVDGTALSQGYYELARPILEELMLAAAVRLAATLNANIIS